MTAPAIITRSCRALTDAERLAAYLAHPAAIERRTFRVWPWQRPKAKASAAQNVVQIGKRKRVGDLR